MSEKANPQHVVRASASRREIIKMGATILPLWVQLRLAHGYPVPDEYLKAPANRHDDTGSVRLARPSGCEAPCTSSCTSSCTQNCTSDCEGGCQTACTGCTSTCEGSCKESQPRPMPIPKPWTPGTPVPGCGEDYWVKGASL